MGSSPGTDPGPVRQVAVPADARSLTTLASVEYEDGFLADVPAVEARTAEGWARAVLEGAPSALRRGLTTGWSAIGLRLGGRPPERFVLGWEVRRSTPEFVLLGADSPLGLAAELLFQRRADALFFATFVRHVNVLGRAVWAGIEPMHRPVVRHVLAQACHREESAAPAGRSRA